MAEAVDGSVASEDVITCVHENRCVPRRSDFTPFEVLISQCRMAFELEFPESVKIVCKQGYLEKLMNLDVVNAKMSGQLQTLRVEIERVWEDKFVAIRIIDSNVEKTKWTR